MSSLKPKSCPQITTSTDICIGVCLSPQSKLFDSEEHKVAMILDYLGTREFFTRKLFANMEIVTLIKLLL